MWLRVKHLWVMWHDDCKKIRARIACNLYCNIHLSVNESLSYNICIKWKIYIISLKLILPFFVKSNFYCKIECYFCVCVCGVSVFVCVLCAEWCVCVGVWVYACVLCGVCVSAVCCVAFVYTVQVVPWCGKSINRGPFSAKMGDFFYIMNLCNYFLF